MKKLTIAVLAVLIGVAAVATQGAGTVAVSAEQAQYEQWVDENPAIAEAMSPEGQARLYESMLVEKQQQTAIAYDHSHHHTDCAYVAQLIIWYITGGTGTLNEWPWSLTGFRTPFLFYGDTHTQCEIKNVYYGYPDYTWVLLNIDHTPVDEGTHDWAIVPVGSF